MKKQSTGNIELQIEKSSRWPGMAFPTPGNRIPDAWEPYSQPLGTTVPAAGNSRPNRWGTILPGNQGNTGCRQTDRPTGRQKRLQERGIFPEQERKSKEENVFGAFFSLLFPN